MDFSQDLRADERVSPTEVQGNSESQHRPIATASCGHFRVAKSRNFRCLVPELSTIVWRRTPPPGRVPIGRIYQFDVGMLIWQDLDGATQMF